MALAGVIVAAAAEELAAVGLGPAAALVMAEVRLHGKVWQHA